MRPHGTHDDPVSVNGERSNATGNAVAKVCEDGGLRWRRNGELDERSSKPALVATLREALDVLENPPSGGCSDHLGSTRRPEAGAVKPWPRIALRGTTTASTRREPHRRGRAERGAPRGGRAPAERHDRPRHEGEAVAPRRQGLGHARLAPGRRAAQVPIRSLSPARRVGSSPAWISRSCWPSSPA